jgi:hypothetical protein
MWQTVKTAAFIGLIGGLMGAVMSALINFALVGMPSSTTINAMNHAISGLTSGFFGGFIGLLVFLAQRQRASRSATA